MSTESCEKMCRYLETGYGWYPCNSNAAPWSSSLQRRTKNSRPFAPFVCAPPRPAPPRPAPPRPAQWKTRATPSPITSTRILPRKHRSSRRRNPMLHLFVLPPTPTHTLTMGFRVPPPTRPLVPMLLLHRLGRLRSV